MAEKLQLMSIPNKQTIDINLRGQVNKNLKFNDVSSELRRWYSEIAWHVVTTPGPTKLLS
jgi:hypothetical protein